MVDKIWEDIWLFNPKVQFLNYWSDNAATSELETALSSYKSIVDNAPDKPIWAVAENYRFEPAFVEVLCFHCSWIIFTFSTWNILIVASQGRKLMTEVGDVMSIQVIVEGSMNSSNPYFSSSWRRDFTVSDFFQLLPHSLEITISKISWDSFRTTLVFFLNKIISFMAGRFHSGYGCTFHRRTEDGNVTFFKYLVTVKYGFGFCEHVLFLLMYSLLLIQAWMLKFYLLNLTF